MEKRWLLGNQNGRRLPAPRESPLDVQAPAAFRGKPRDDLPIPISVEVARGEREASLQFAIRARAPRQEDQRRPEHSEIPRFALYVHSRMIEWDGGIASDKLFRPFPEASRPRDHGRTRGHPGRSARKPRTVPETRVPSEPVIGAGVSKRYDGNPAAIPRDSVSCAPRRHMGRSEPWRQHRPSGL